MTDNNNKKLRLSPYHKIFYNEWKLNPHSNVYNIVFDQTLSQNLNFERLKDALCRFIKDHLIFNSHILEQDQEAYWVKNDQIYFLEQFDSDQKIYEYVSRPFNLETSPLYRFAVFKQKENYRLILVLHHIVIDGNSFDSLIYEISAYYNEITYKTSKTLQQQAEDLIQITDLVYSKLEQIANFAHQFWKNNLTNTESIDMRFLKSIDSVIQDNNANQIKNIQFKFSAEFINRLKQHNLGISIYTLSQIIFAILLNRYTFQSKYGLCYPVAIKEYLDLYTGAGINTVLSFYDIKETTTVLDLVQQQQQYIKELKGNNYIYHLINKLNNYDKRILDIIFAQTNLKDIPFNFADVNVININQDFEIDLPAKLCFLQQLRNNTLKFQIKYDVQEIDEKILNQFIIHYQKLFIDVIKDLEQNNLKKPISQYQILTQEEYQKIVYDWNNTTIPYPNNKTIHQLFEEQVERNPDNIAIVYENVKLTYQELNQRANQLANYILNNYQINPDDLIILCLDRSEQMVIAMLGILKAGAAYVPIDNKCPVAKIKHILKDTQAQLIITNDKYIDKFNKINFLSILPLDNYQIKQQLLLHSIKNPSISVTESNLVYTIYTSGTTGNPKGVLIEHKNVVNFAIAMNNYLFTNSNHIYKFLWFTNYTFDAHVLELYPAIIFGNQVFILSEEHTKNLSELREYIIANQIEIALIPPALLSQLEILNLKILIVGGEKTNPNTIDRYYNSGIRIINAYGPTEGTVCTTLNFYNRNGYNNIGKPIYNTRTYILDGYQTPVPIGAVGELYISGDGLARGYLNKPELTQKYFIRNCFQTKTEREQNKNNWLYKTGDICRYLPDSNIEYIGRSDFQIKLRGYRIELGEIESKLLCYPTIKQAVVTLRESMDDNTSANKYLVAYYVSDIKLNELEIKNYLSSSLPDYMLPHGFIQMDNLPFTINGKIDKNALPLPNLTNQDNYVPPKNTLQTQLINAWAEIFKLPAKSISITDNFFKLGGNSILAISLKSKLSKIPELRNIKISEIFAYPTIEQMAHTAQTNLGLENKSYHNNHGFEADIAIIAMSGAFSGCRNLDEYWNLIESGVEGIKHHIYEECKNLGVAENILENKSFIRSSGHIPEPDTFDIQFWNLTPNEAKYLDPQIRKFLEHCWYALENSGYSNKRKNLNIGVFAGVGNSNYLLKDQSYSDNLMSYRGINNMNVKDIIATKTSYLLGLIGVAKSTATACSTSLVNIVEACIYLNSGHCDMALAGGVSLLMPEEVGYMYQEGMICSKDGHCRPFDKNSSGTVPGSGVGVVLLKRLSDAIKDNDNIIAVIKGYATNNDGDRKATYVAPSFIGQKECIIKAHQMANISSDMINYVECHGTGTNLGDPIEIQGLNEAFKYTSNKPYNGNKCFIGSVKANIGHTDVAAGIAGLLKVCKMLEHNIIPKQINYSIPNSELDLGETVFDITTEIKTWEKAQGIPRFAGVSSFGIGGTNAHIIISDYIPPIKNTNDQTLVSETQNYILPLSAKTKPALYAYQQKFIDYLSATSDNIEDIAYSLQLKREFYSYRKSIVCTSIEDAINKLHNNNFISKISNKSKSAQEIIFMFPGQGNQYSNMTLDLYLNIKNYRDTVDNCLNYVNKYTDFPFETILFPALHQSNTANSIIHQTQFAQLALFIIDYSLAKLLEFLKINAISYIGHSIGELVAATLSGVFSLEDAIYLVFMRGKLMQSMPKGGMLLIKEELKKIQNIILDHDCSLAVINSPNNHVVSGTKENINKLKSNLDDINIVSIILNVSHPCHSFLMAKSAKEFKHKFDNITLNIPQKPFISNITGSFITAKQATDSQYWVDHILKPVEFSNGLKTLCEYYSNPLFIEVGPGKSCLSFLKQHNFSRINTVQLINSYSEQQDIYKFESDSNLKDKIGLSKTSYSALVNCEEAIINRLWLGGYKIDFDAYFDYKNCKIVKLPNYQFDNQSYWLERSQNKQTSTNCYKEKSLPNATKAMDIKSMVVEKNQSHTCYCIAAAFIEVLGVKSISIYDDFFDLGGDSLLAINLLSKLQVNYKLSLADIFEFRTIVKISENIMFIRGNLLQKLEQVKLFYVKQDAYLLNENIHSTDLIIKHAAYLMKSQSFTFKKSTKKIKSVLLTGATGHVGCNILDQLLRNTDYKIYLLLRKYKEEDCFKRLEAKYKYYFDIGLEAFFERIIVLNSDIEKPDLGITASQYQELKNNIDSIIHAAGLVKHYGDKDKFYSTNVQTTINLLELAKQTSSKDFHYISTLAVIADVYIPNQAYYIFDEDDNLDLIARHNNIYAKTKHEAELVTIKYRDFGINTSIYRLGNVAMHSINYRHQPNIKDNAFFVILNTIVNLGMIANEIDTVEISPGDLTALAIVKLFQQKELNNMVYHVFNPNLCRLSTLLNSKSNKYVKMCTLEDFMDNIIDILNTGNDAQRQQLELFMLHMSWLHEVNTDNITKIEILQNKTNNILAKLGFTWPTINRDMLLKILE